MYLKNRKKKLTKKASTISSLDNSVIKVEGLNHLVKSNEDRLLTNDSITCYVCNCNITKKNFTQNGLDSHKGEKPFTCEACENKCSSSSKTKIKKKRKRTKNTTLEQYATYLEFLEYDIKWKKNFGEPSQKECNPKIANWSDLVDNLNEMGNGLNLTSEEWRKRFSDWKYATRSKHRKLLDAQQEGLKSSCYGFLTPLEERAISLWEQMFPSIERNVAGTSEPVFISLPEVPSSTNTESETDMSSDVCTERLSDVCTDQLSDVCTDKFSDMCTEKISDVYTEKDKQTKCLEGILSELKKQNKLFGTFLKLQFPQYKEEDG